MRFEKFLGVIVGLFVIMRDLMFGREELSRRAGLYGVRWHLLGPLWRVLSKRLGFPSLYLNHFIAPDDPIPHNHPRWILSFILSGGYVEFRRGEPFAIRKQGTFNWIGLGGYHFIRPLSPKGAWTITLVGPTWGRRWGFWYKGRHVDSKAYKAVVLGVYNDQTLHSQPHVSTQEKGHLTV